MKTCNSYLKYFKILYLQITLPDLKDSGGLGAQKIAGRFPAANDFDGPSRHQNFRWPWACIVVRGQHHPISAGIENCEQSALFHPRQLSIAREEIARLAHRAHDIQDFFPG